MVYIIRLTIQERMTVEISPCFQAAEIPVQHVLVRRQNFVFFMNIF
jgi:hypothetical protein